MTRSPKSLIAIGVVGVALITLLTALLDTGSRQSATLEFHGYAPTASAQKIALFLLTNSGPALVEYSAIQEESNMNSFRAQGVLPSRSGQEFRVPFEDHPTRLVVNCSPRLSRNVRETLRRLLGMQVGGSNYVLVSEELK